MSRSIPESCEVSPIEVEPFVLPSRNPTHLDEDLEGPSTTSAPFTSYEVRTLETEDEDGHHAIHSPSTSVDVGAVGLEDDDQEHDQTLVLGPAATAHAGPDDSREVSTPFLSLSSLRSQHSTDSSPVSSPREQSHYIRSVGKRSRFFRRSFQSHLFGGSNSRPVSTERDSLLGGGGGGGRGAWNRLSASANSSSANSSSTLAAASRSATWYQLLSVGFVLLLGVVLLILFVSIIRRAYFAKTYVYVRYVQWDAIPAGTSTQVKYTLKLSVRNLNFRSLDVLGLRHVTVSVVDPNNLFAYNLTMLDDRGHFAYGSNMSVSPDRPVAFARGRSDIDVRIAGDLRRYTSKQLGRIQTLLHFGHGQVSVVGILGVGSTDVSFQKQQWLMLMDDDDVRRKVQEVRQSSHGLRDVG